MAFRVAIIGCGGIAGGYDMDRFDPNHPLTHAGALARHSGFSITVCVDPDRERATRFASRWGISETLPDAAKLLERAEGLDTVVICSPTSHHGVDLDVALRMRPRLVVCEKPITLSYETSRYWVERFAAEGIPLLVNHTRRWAPDIVRLVEEIRSGGRGELRSISGVYNKGLMNNGSHMVDLIRMFVDGCDVIGVGNPVHDHFPHDPSVPFMLRSRDGIPITVNTSHAADYALFELELFTSTGTVRMEAGGMRFRERSVVDSDEFPGYRVLGADRVASGEYRGAMAAMVDNQYRFLTTGQRLACDGGTALDTQRLCAAIKMAA
ncbi:MAG: Gfo/Idh/MocA family oxidoreductase [Gammaproteobacteria bacterium]|nr:Gfo/Idh/MocA family oxidoreductase [Gammaproteobacteria bacterium]